MADTKIEWAHKVWNPVTGCSKVSPGCLHCYAERMAKRLAGRYGYPEGNGFAVTLHPEHLGEPLNWRKPKRIFPCSMGDLFHEAVPDEFLLQAFETMAISPGHRYLVLTKRIERMRDWWVRMRVGECSHIWPGVTVCNQEEADAKLPVLLSIPAAGHWVSVEPMLGLVDIAEHLPYYVVSHRGEMDPKTTEAMREVFIAAKKYFGAQGLGWVVAGCETGPGARPTHPDWFRSLRDQCAAAGVPFFLKAVDLKRNHLLDGVAHREIPEALRVGGE